MKLYQHNYNYTNYMGWYGSCDSTCETINLNESEFSIISSAYEFPKNGVGVASYIGGQYDYLNSFSELVCGNAYILVLEPGNGYVHIPGFTLSYYEKNFSSGMISKECGSSSLPDEEKTTPTPRSNDDANSSSKKILALHGGGDSSYGLRNQQGSIDLMNSLPDVEFVFVDSPSNSVWMQDPPGGKDDPTTDPNWANDSIEYLDNLVAQQGPFFGILGYSQGAAFIPVYLANTSNTFDIALMYNGYLPSTHQGLMSSVNASAPFDIPAVVFSGEYDYAFKDMAPDLYDKFSNGIYVRSSSAGHHLPYSSDSTYNQILNYINSVEPTVTSSNYTADSAFLNYTGSESDRSSREVIGGDDGNTSLYCRVSAAIENVDGTDKLVVRSNGVPNYTPKVGSTIIQGSWSDELSVSSDGNPNIIGEQDYTFTIPLIDVTINPVNTESDDFNNVTETALSAIGVSSNGVPIFNPWHNNQGDFLASSRDAITFATFSSCCGHPSGAGPGRTGAGPYHYHKYPTCIAGNRGLSPTSDIIEEQDMADILDEKLTKTGAEGHSPILGYMIDGYPVYGPIGTTDTTFTSSTSLKVLKSSFVLNGDVYEYVRGNGDLDKCNAIYSATPEYPNGCYHYVLSLDSNSDGTVKRTENPLYIYRDNDSNEQKMIITPMYPHTTVYYRGSEFGSFTNGDNTTSINPNDDPCAGFGVTWGPTIGPPPDGCNQQPPQ